VSQLTNKYQMKDGEKAILIPGVSTMGRNGTSTHKLRVDETLRAMTEEVTIISLVNTTGNVKVKDAKDVVFFCNMNDLRPCDDYHSYEI